MSIDQEINIIGIIGDIHAEDQLLGEAISFLKGQGVEMILCVGDIADGQGDVDLCCTMLRHEGIQAVQGNHDRWLLEHWMRDVNDATQLDDISHESTAYLYSLPTTYEFLTPGGASLLCHGLGNNVMAKVTPDDYGYAIEANMELQQFIQERKYHYIINGHTHEAMVRSFDQLTIINAGSLKRGHTPGFLIVDFCQGYVQFFSFDATSIIQESATVHLTGDVYSSPKTQPENLLERIKGQGK